MPIEPIAAVRGDKGNPSSLDQALEYAEKQRELRTASTANTASMTPQDQQRIQDLRERDAAVKAHEQAHLTVAGQYAIGQPTYKFVIGPDGQQYAVGGEVRLDTSVVADDADATIRKMEQIKAAALAPSDPSGQDYAVASQATAQAVAVRQAQADVETSQGQPAVETGQGQSEAEDGQGQPAEQAARRYTLPQDAGMVSRLNRTA
jgi:hypothetical protein